MKGLQLFLLGPECSVLMWQCFRRAETNGGSVPGGPVCLGVNINDDRLHYRLIRELERRPKYTPGDCSACLCASIAVLERI